MENYREPQENTVLILLINWSIVNNFVTYEINFLLKGFLITWNFGDTLI